MDRITFGIDGLTVKRVFVPKRSLSTLAPNIDKNDRYQYFRYQHQQTARF